MLDSSFVTQSEYQKHIRGEWRTVHNLWPHIRTYVPGHGYSRKAIDAKFAGTEGSIAFASEFGFISEDNANLFWDAANARLGIHETTPTALVHINSVGGSIPALNLESGSEGEIVTPDTQQLRIGHWNGVDRFTERMKIDADGKVYISYLTTGSVIFAGAGGEIKQNNANFFWSDAAGLRVGEITIVDGRGLNLQEYINFTGGGGANLILFPDDLASALSLREGGNSYISFRTTDGNERIDVYKTLKTCAIIIDNGYGLSLEEDITFTGATAQNLIKFPDNLPTALDFREAGNSYLKFVTTDGSEAVNLAKTLILSAVINAGEDTDKFLVLDAGNRVDFRTGAELLADIGGGGNGAATFLDLTDTPANYDGAANKIVKVNDTPDALEFGADIEDLEDVDTIVGQAGKYAKVKAADAGIEWVVGVGAITEFPDLVDTPANYVDQAGKFCKVKETEDGLEFAEGGGNGEGYGAEVIDEIFDSLIDGDIHGQGVYSGWGTWNTDEEDADCSAQIAANPGNGKMLRLSDANAAGLVNTRLDADAGHEIVQCLLRCKMRISSFADTNKRGYIGIWDKDARHTGIYFRDNFLKWWTGSATVNVVAAAANTWYDVVIFMDCTAAKAVIWVDGVLILTGQSCQTQDIKSFSFYTLSAGTGYTVDFDDLLIVDLTRKP